MATETCTWHLGFEHLDEAQRVQQLFEERPAFSGVELGDADILEISFSVTAQTQLQAEALISNILEEAHADSAFWC